jgi:hypothetical protein
MAKARAVLVGVKNMQDKSWSDGAEDAEFDVDQMKGILSGFDAVHCLKTACATESKVLATITSAVQNLTADDLFVFYFAGHGIPGDGSETRHQLVLYDEFLNTADLGKIWLTLPAGMRVVMISESCNSGTDYYKYLASLGLRLEGTELAVAEIAPAENMRAADGLYLLPEAAPIASADSLRWVDQSWVKQLGIISPFGDDVQASQMKAEMIHFGASADGRSAQGGVFTAALVKVWQNGAVKNYRDFFCQILSAVATADPSQNPEYRPYGPVNQAFENQSPFTIPPPTPVLGLAKAVLGRGDC